MRCVALGQAWKRAGGAVTFLLPEGNVGIEERVSAEGLSLERLPHSSESSPESFVRAALEACPHIAVLDGYSFGAREQEILSETGIRVLTVDDYGHATDYPVRWVLNQNPYAASETYSHKNVDTELLLGAKYALLRDEFLPWTGWRRSIPERARNVLITIGGSDPDNASERILQSLEPLSRRALEVVLVVGGTNPHWDALQAASKRSSFPVRLVRSALNMPALMAWADVAISGAGGTSYELCYMGLPSLLLIVAENQRLAAERLAASGVAINAGTTQEFQPESFVVHLESLIDSAERRAAMSDAGRGLVDGFGSERVCAALFDRELKLRLVRETDCQLLFDWAIEPAARAASFQSAAISWDSHVQWFSERLRDPECVIYIGENAADEPVGMVRFHIKGDSAVLSVSVARHLRSVGWGRGLIAFATHSLVRTRSIRRIDAFVKPENDASVRLFDAMGYRRVATEKVSGQDALLFVREWRNEADVNEIRIPRTTLESHGPPSAAQKHGVKIAIAQPTYLPWLGYFDLIDQVDKFVLLDTVQFEKQSWQQRNRIKTPTGLQWLTVPVIFRGRLGQRIVDVEIREPEFWRHHLRAIELNYRRAPCFDKYFPALQELLRSASSGLRLADFSISLLRWLIQTLGITTPIVRSSELPVSGKRTQLLAEVCGVLGATTYISPLGSADYLLGELPILTDRGVDVVFQHYEHPQYRQMFPTFEAHASVLDLLFNEGENSLSIMRSGRRSPFAPTEVATRLELDSIARQTTSQQ
jgi:UDP-2,4-diacetamido-2,4,6-trideoxy-beta-L-altropyranose hydrolase